jgi:hypothetical protein
MRTYRAFGPLLAVAAALVASGCDTFPAQQAIGVTRGPEGDPEIVYVACRGESIKGVEIVIPVDNPGGGADTVLWRIESQRTAPNGFLETVLAHRFRWPTQPRSPIEALSQ